jgi:hypothetical protein
VREAREEICGDVRLVSSKVSYFHDIDTDDVARFSCPDVPAPLLLQRIRNLQPDRPFRPGLPAGPFTYFGIYLAELPWGAPRPGDDVVGLLIMPLALWSAVEKGPNVREIIDLGATAIMRTPQIESRRLWVAPGESFRTVFRLLRTELALLDPATWP